jgi:hypothetical protein
MLAGCQTGNAPQSGDLIDPIEVDIYVPPLPVGYPPKVGDVRALIDG